MDSARKQWTDPVLTTFGSVAAVTQQEIKDKSIGGTDDFAINGISDP